MSAGPPAPSPEKYLRQELDAIAREFYRRLSEEGQLATTRCESCVRTAFPPRARCPGCGGPLAWVELPRRGRLYAFTSQETALRFRAPALLALVELGEVVVPGIVQAAEAELTIGREVWVEPFVEPDTGMTLLSFTTSRR